MWQISKFTTRYHNHDDPNRIHNIKIGSYKIDNTIVPAGGTFSLLEKLGDITGNTGYKEARVVIQGEMVKQYGGGVCQIATTLYNAALLADLEIIERRNHGVYFSLYPLGRDAMIYSGESDLVIKNPYDFPILIKSYQSDNGITFKILGTEAEKEVFFTKPVIYVKGEILKREGEGVPSEEAFSFDLPFSTKVIKYTKMNGKSVSKEIIRSYYRFAGEGTLN